MNAFLSKYKWQLAGTALGLLGGFLYWYFIGCISGTCPIQSNWHISTLMGGLIGYLVSDLLYDLIKKPNARKEDKDGTI